MIISKNSPLVTIIMGVYNSSTTLKRAIESILNQTYSNFEFIICDDCSTDDSYNILYDYSMLDNRIILIKNHKNESLANSLNKCLNKASKSSIFIARMDADDYSHPKRIEDQINFLLKNNSFHLVSCKSNIITLNGKIHSVRGKAGEVKRIKLLYGPPFVHPSIMIKKEVILNLKGYNQDKKFLRLEDYELWFRFYSNNYRAYCLDKLLFDYYERPPKITFNFLKRSIYIRLYGYKINKFPFFYYIALIKPFISFIFPYPLKAFLRTLIK